MLEASPQGTLRRVRSGAMRALSVPEVVPGEWCLKNFRARAFWKRALVAYEPGPTWALSVAYRPPRPPLFKDVQKISGPIAFRCDSFRALVAYASGPTWALSAACRLPRPPLFRKNCKASGARILRGDSPRTLAAHEPGPMWALSVACRLQRSPLFKKYGAENF